MSNKPEHEVLIWELPVRVFHWSLVALVTLAWLTGDDDGGWVLEVHEWAGYGVLALVLFRVIWGLIGGRYARFRDFVRPWRVVRAYARRLAALAPPPSLGHNPLGGWMIVVLLATLALLVVTGLLGGEHEVAGPFAATLDPDLSEALGELHEALSGVILALIAVHIAGVLVDSLLTGDNLVGAMLTGRKPLPPGAPREAGEGAAAAYWRVGLALAVTAVLVGWLRALH